MMHSDDVNKIVGDLVEHSNRKLPQDGSPGAGAYCLIQLWIALQHGENFVWLAEKLTTKPFGSSLVPGTQLFDVKLS